MLRVAVAAVAGALLLSVLNAVTYGLIIPDAVEANQLVYEGLVKDPPDLLPYLLYGLLWMSLLAYAFEFWATIRSFARGAVAGAVYWAALVLGLNLNNVAHFNLLENFVVIVPMKVAAAAIAGALVGGVMAAILGWGSRGGPIHEPDPLARR